MPWVVIKPESTILSQPVSKAPVNIAMHVGDQTTDRVAY